MMQQINLYQEQLRPQKKPFSAASMTISSCIFVVLLAMIYFYSAYQLSSVETRIQAIDNDLANLRGQVETLVTQFPEKQESKLITSEIARLSRELDKRQAIGRALEKHAIDNKRGFSDLLESLARQHIQGTWLTHVAINDGGESLSFEGLTYSSELVPAYIRQLSDEATFKGLVFNVLEMQRGEEGSDELQFQVATRERKL